MKQLLLLLAIAGSMFGQNAPLRFSVTSGDVSLTAAGTTITVQPPASSSSGRRWVGESAFVYCSVACNVTMSKNGAAATATAGSWTLINPGAFGSAFMTVYTASNVGAGTAVGGILHVAAGQTIAIDLSKITLGNTGSATNFSIAVSSITGTANITIIGSEQ